jgi:hypothetical protein
LGGWVERANSGDPVWRSAGCLKMQSLPKKVRISWSLKPVNATSGVPVAGRRTNLCAMDHIRAAGFYPRHSSQRRRVQPSCAAAKAPTTHHSVMAATTFFDVSSLGSSEQPSAKWLALLINVAKVLVRWAVVVRIDRVGGAQPSLLIRDWPAHRRLHLSRIQSDVLRDLAKKSPATWSEPRQCP